MNKALALKQSDYQDLRKHLFPGNGLEAAAIMLCHSGMGQSSLRLMVKEIIPIPQDSCEQITKDYLSWPFASYMTNDTI